MPILLLILALLAPPPAPAPVWHQGVLVVSFSGGTLHRADGLRGLYAWPAVCAASPCEAPVRPGDALAVIGQEGTSAVVVVGPAPIALPIVTGP